MSGLDSLNDLALAAAMKGALSGDDRAMQAILLGLASLRTTRDGTNPGPGTALADRWLTTAEVAQRCRISERQVYRYLNAGALRPRRLGRDWRFSIDEVDALIDAGLPSPKKLLEVGRHLALTGPNPEQAPVPLRREG